MLLLVAGCAPVESTRLVEPGRVVEAVLSNGPVRGHGLLVRVVGLSRTGASGDRHERGGDEQAEQSNGSSQQQLVMAQVSPFAATASPSTTIGCNRRFASPRFGFLAGCPYGGSACIPMVQGSCSVAPHRARVPGRRTPPRLQTPSRSSARAWTRTFRTLRDRGPVEDSGRPFFVECERASVVGGPVASDGRRASAWARRGARARGRKREARRPGFASHSFEVLQVAFKHGSLLRDLLRWGQACSIGDRFRDTFSAVSPVPALRGAWCRPSDARRRERES
jgi:hypothetical protein